MVIWLSLSISSFFIDDFNNDYVELGPVDIPSIQFYFVNAKFDLSNKLFEGYYTELLLISGISALILYFDFFD